MTDIQERAQWCVENPAFADLGAFSRWYSETQDQATMRVEDGVLQFSKKTAAPAHRATAVREVEPA